MKRNENETEKIFWKNAMREKNNYTMKIILLSLIFILLSWN